MKYIKILLALPLIGCLTMPAYANSDSSHFQSRIDKQHMKIKKGIKSGELTKREAKSLRREHRHISKLNKLFMQDGELNRFEKRTLKNELKTAKYRIKKLTHNERKHFDRYSEYDEFWNSYH